MHTRGAVLSRVKVAVRVLRPEDEPRLYMLAGECFGPELPGDETVAVLTRCHVFVAETTDDEIAGYVALVDEGVDLCIRQLLVAPAQSDEQRHVGDQLCDWVEGYAINHGFERVRIDVGDDERTARQFYVRRGYRPARVGGLELDLPHVVDDD
jgi:Acetyltransferase (GNAT) family